MQNFKAIKSSLIITTLAVLLSCSQSGQDTGSVQQQIISDSVFSDEVTAFGVQVYYEQGSEPYVGTITLGITSYPTWSIFEESFKALFSTHTARTVSAPENPETLDSMQNIGPIGRSSWSYSQLKALGDKHVTNWDQNGNIRLGIIYVAGTYNGNANILGLHLTGTPYAFIFKDIVESVGASNQERKFIEQAVVVHEVGHVIGLVNSGVAMHQPHEDSEHSHHTQNSDCVMYWAVETATGIGDFINGLLGADNRQLFGPESLADGRGFHP